MSTEQAGAVVIQVTAEDFTRLWEQTGAWAEVSLQLGRFEALDSSDGPDFRDWKRIYWVGREYASVIFARAFLAARGFGYEVLYDTASDEAGAPMFGYVILTDYEGER